MASLESVGKRLLDRLPASETARSPTVAVGVVAAGAVVAGAWNNFGWGFGSGLGWGLGSSLGWGLGGWAGLGGWGGGGGLGGWGGGLGGGWGLSSWCFGSPFYDWGYGSYFNPYAVGQQRSWAGSSTSRCWWPATRTGRALSSTTRSPWPSMPRPPQDEAPGPAILRPGRGAFKLGQYDQALRAVDSASLTLAPGCHAARVPLTDTVRAGALRRGGRRHPRRAGGWSRLELADPDRPVSRRRDLHAQLRASRWLARQQADQPALGSCWLITTSPRATLKRRPRSLARWSPCSPRTSFPASFWNSLATPGSRAVAPAGSRLAVRRGQPRQRHEAAGRASSRQPQPRGGRRTRLPA